MHRYSLWMFLLAALYVSGRACATDVLPVPQAEKPAPHIALLLPLKSVAFKRAAETVQQGFLAAASTQPRVLPVRVYGSADEARDISALYRQALASGARAVVGPLTRSGVATLAAEPGIAVPTLALNMFEGKSSDKLYFFGLSAEAEARQAVQMALDAGLRGAIMISTNSPLSKRLSQAFAEEWKLRGGYIEAELLYNDDPAIFADLAAEPDSMAFLAADAETARLIRPYLNGALPVYATSQLFNGNADTLGNYDLKDAHFVDMPWLLQPDHPAAMIYPRANPPLEPDMERLYALGIDAFRLMQILLDNSMRTALPLDGVTGRIHLNKQRQFQREAIAAAFKQGRALTPEQAAALAAEQAAALAARAASSVAPAAAPAQ